MLQPIPPVSTQVYTLTNSRTVSIVRKKKNVLKLKFYLAVLKIMLVAGSPIRRPLILIEKFSGILKKKIS